MLLEIFLSLGLIFPGLAVLKLIEVRTKNNFERIALSYVLSLVLLFILLYLGAIFNFFNVASIASFALIGLSILYVCVPFVRKYVLDKDQNFSILSSVSKEDAVIIIAAIGLISVYAVFLSSRAILDSDVVQEYLPIGREIFRANGFTYSNGFDFNILLKPVGASVLYAWTYMSSGSIFSETFRLLPLVPMTLLIFLTYSITLSASKSKNIAIISTGIFLVLPFGDRILLYNAFYPDVFYYPLIFSVIYYLIEYLQFKDNKLLLWTGLALGAASLLKAQTIYVFIAYVVVMFVLEFRNYKKLSVLVCCGVPFYMLFPSILANSVRSDGFFFSFPSFSETQWILFVFLSIITGVFAYATFLKTESYAKSSLFKLAKSMIKRLAILLLPFGLISSLWYVNNIAEFGTLIWTSSANLPNMNWAISLLNSLEPVQQTTVSAISYFGHFLFMFIDPALLGFVLLLPLIFGIFYSFRRDIESFNILILFGLILASLIFSVVIFSIPTLSTYNSRDLLPLAPLVTSLSAIGILSVTSRLSKNLNDSLPVIASISLVGFFGLLNYIHSVLVSNTVQIKPTIIGSFMSSISNEVGLSLSQTSLQLSIVDRILFVSENYFEIILLSLICGLPLIILAISQKSNLNWKTLQRKFKYVPRPLYYAEVFILAVLLLHVIILPRAELFAAQGSFQNIKNDQLSRTYGSFNDFIISNTTLQGDILTYKSPKGLPYYLTGLKIIDLSYPANLAYIKDSLIINSSRDTVTKLRNLGICHLLTNPSIIDKLDTALNSTFSKITQDIELSRLTKKLGDWQLYTLGPFLVEKDFIPLSSWLIEPQLTSAPYIFYSNENSISLELDPVDADSRVTIFNLTMPKLNMSSYDFASVRLSGSNNARILLRFFLNDGTSFDVGYWADVITLANTQFQLNSLSSKSLRGDVYLALKSSDNLSSSIAISEISFVKINY